MAKEMTPKEKKDVLKHLENASDEKVLKTSFRNIFGLIISLLGWVIIYVGLKCMTEDYANQYADELAKKFKGLVG